MRICAVVQCGNGTYQLNRWKQKTCVEHKSSFGTDRCTCTPPFVLFPFPTLKKNPGARRRWVKLINRKQGASGKNWEPTNDDRVCSQHFIDGRPTEAHPDPTVGLGYPVAITNPKRGPPKDRKMLQKCKSRKLDATEPCGGIVTDPSPVPVEDDHGSYCCKCNCSPNCNCNGCLEKELLIRKQAREIDVLKQKLAKLERRECLLQKLGRQNAASKLLKTDAKTREFTGLPNKNSFEGLLSYVKASASKVSYWYGPKKVTSTKVKKNFKASPKKFGPKRKLSSRDELLIVLLKLRLGVTNGLLSELFSISRSTCSQIFNTWIKVLSALLQPLIFWPGKEFIKKCLPTVVKKNCPSLRCIVDCTEVFINRPRHLELQALTWSDYKKHNTVKFLIGIAPNGMISFLSRAWGGRASDTWITRQSGFLKLVEPYDTIMADRGFLISTDLMMCRAKLEIPPPSSGLEQHSREDVRKTEKVANMRIHVERAIGRIKTFALLKNTLPITLVPLVDDIAIVCAALCNLMPPLVN